MSHAIFHEDVSLLVWRPCGVIDEVEVNELTAQLGNLESRRPLPFHRFTDTRTADGLAVNLLYTFHVSLYHRSSSHGPPIKSAILVTGPTKDRYQRLHSFLTQGSPIDVRIFDKRNDAAQWLGVPVALLSPDDDLASKVRSINGASATIHQAA